MEEILYVNRNVCLYTLHGMYWGGINLMAPGQRSRKLHLGLSSNDALTAQENRRLSRTIALAQVVREHADKRSEFDELTDEDLDKLIKIVHKEHRLKSSMGEFVLETDVINSELGPDKEGFVRT